MSKKSTIPSKNSILSTHVLNFIKSYVNEQTSVDSAKKDVETTQFATESSNEAKSDLEIQSVKSSSIQSQYRSPLHSQEEHELTSNANKMQIDDTKTSNYNEMYKYFLS